MRRDAFSLIEVLLSITIAVAATTAIISFVWAPRERIAARSCELRQAELQLRAEEYFRSRGQWPSSSLRELQSARTRFRFVPIDGMPYQFNRSTQQVESHGHAGP